MQSLGKLAALLVVTMTYAGRLDGQEQLEAAVSARLQAMLSLPATDTVRVVRDYSPQLFPQMTFYRASVRPNGSHTKERRAGIVAMAGELLPIAAAGDLSAVWARLGSGPRSLNEDVARWADLLYRTGVLPACPTVVHSSNELLVGFKAFLQPQERLGEIAPPQRQADGNRTQLLFFVRSPEGIHEVRVTQPPSAAPIVSVTLIMVAGNS